MTSTNEPMGRLERVDLREAWGTEDGDFTPWLAREENIALLGDAIGIDLEVEAQEKRGWAVQGRHPVPRHSHNRQTLDFD